MYRDSVYRLHEQSRGHTFVPSDPTNERLRYTIEGLGFERVYMFGACECGCRGYEVTLTRGFEVCFALRSDNLVYLIDRSTRHISLAEV